MVLETKNTQLSALKEHSRDTAPVCPEAGSGTLMPPKPVFAAPVLDRAGMLPPPQLLLHCLVTGTREGMPPPCNLTELVAHMGSN